jgi:hypothetical protein
MYHFVMNYLYLIYLQNILEYTHSYAANRFELKFDEILSDGDYLAFFHSAIIGLLDSFIPSV